MSPLAWRLERDEVVVQAATHRDDAVSHAFDFFLPLLVQLRAVQDSARDARTVERGIRVHGADKDLKLTLHTLLLTLVSGGHGERTDALSVKTHVLCERLGERDLVTLRDEVTHGKRVARGVTRGEALVGHVEEGVDRLLLDDVGELLPLLGRRIDTSRVVCTCVQQNQGVSGDVLPRRVRGELTWL